MPCFDPDSAHPYRCPRRRRPAAHRRSSLAGLPDWYVEAFLDYDPKNPGEFLARVMTALADDLFEGGASPEHGRRPESAEGAGGGGSMIDPAPQGLDAGSISQNTGFQKQKTEFTPWNHHTCPKSDTGRRYQSDVV